MRVVDLSDIIHSMQNETEFVLRCEEQYHDRISAISAVILHSEKPFVALTGPSGSGKTTTAMRLKDYLENLGKKVILVSMDNFFYPDRDAPKEANGDWESPYYVNRESLLDCLDRLSMGETADIPIFDYKKNEITGHKKMEGSRDAIIICEGIHMLNPLIFDGIRDRATGVYVSPRTRLITPDDEIVKPEVVRVARRMIRDYRSRGASLQSTVQRAQQVDAGETNYIQPYKSNADLHLDSFLDYELCLLSRYIRDICSFRDELTPEFMEAHGLSLLLKVVHRLPPLKGEYVPKDSLIREFIGGSKYRY